MRFQVYHFPLPILLALIGYGCDAGQHLLSLMLEGVIGPIIHKLMLLCYFLLLFVDAIVYTFPELSGGIFSEKAM